MRKEITMQDCLDLKSEFDAYFNIGEKNQISLIVLVYPLLVDTIESIKNKGRVENQKDIRAMFRVIKMIMGKDYSKYKEQES